MYVLFCAAVFEGKLLQQGTSNAALRKKKKNFENNEKKKVIAENTTLHSVSHCYPSRTAYSKHNYESTTRQTA